ncbi:helix-turn-helix domain-containing protein [Microbacteriaceae bacterium VKM Ac-2854]|nr:helix-turn-helix domain-containing protein [Microbacteriaceae bacterium VKM Ac-2854]
MTHDGFEFDPRLIWPGQLIGAADVATILERDRSTVIRMVRDGRLHPLAQLDGPTGAYVFDRSDIRKPTA